MLAKKRDTKEPHKHWVFQMLGKVEKPLETRMDAGFFIIYIYILVS